MRLSDLRDQTVRSLDGKSLGRVHEVHCESGKVVALICGPSGMLERLTGRGSGSRIAWDSVRKVDSKGVWIAPPKEKASASRSRRGTRQPSARRSKR
jgi:sporulation protein YlmC with PRC-barrel domain